MGERACPTSHRVRTKRRRAAELVDLVVERRSCHVSRGPLVRRLAALHGWWWRSWCCSSCSRCCEVQCSRAQCRVRRHEAWSGHGFDAMGGLGPVSWAAVIHDSRSK